MDDASEKESQQNVELLFLSIGGRIGRVLERAHLARGVRLHAGRVALLLSLLTWLPLLLLSMIEGVAWGNRVDISMTQDFLPYGQFLLAVPLLIVGGHFVGARLAWVVGELRDSEILDQDGTLELNRVLDRAMLRWKGGRVQTTLVVVTCAITALSLLDSKVWLTGGWQSSDGRPTLPGWWYLLVSMPVLRFLVLRWLWRLGIWIWVLWRTSRLTLRLRPTHPDRAGGLAFLGATQATFGVLGWALGVQLSCLVANAVAYRGAELMSFKGQFIAFVLIVVTVLVLPLLAFTPKMIRTREEYLLFLTGRCYRSADELDRGLREDQQGESHAAEISDLTGLGALFERAHQMRPIPLELRHVVVLVLLTALPFAPLVFLVMPAESVLEALIKLLL